MRIEVRQNILASNSAAAESNRERLDEAGVRMLNVMASPGAGKTSAIMSLIEGVRVQARLAVIEGDIASEIDALAIEAVGIPAIQINTGGSCHLTAPMVGQALDHLELETLDLVIIENVGNLVCPAEFDLGETSRTMIASVAEGHDKPEKYPLIFREVDAVLLNKIDLMGHCDFDLERFREVVTALNPGAPLIEMSCREGTGIEEWRRWVLESVVAGEPSGRDRLARQP